MLVRNAELDVAIAELRKSEAGFDAIERDLNTLKLHLCGDKPDVLQAIQDCTQQIVEHERGVNKQLSHFNKTLNAQAASKSLVASSDTALKVFDSIDDLIARHLSALGYATIAEAIQESNARVDQVSHIQNYISEVLINDSMREITCGEYGGGNIPLEASTNAQAISENARKHSENSNSPAFEHLGLTHKDTELARSPAHSCTVPEELILRTAEFRRQKQVEYLFLKHLCVGTSDALQYLQTAAAKAELDATQVAALAGRLVTTDTASAREELTQFILSLRTELLVLARGTVNLGSDLSTLINVSKSMLEKHLIALQSTEWNATTELPFEIDLPASQRFHQVIVCPVTKEQIRPDELKVLPCQHIISRSALRELITELYELKCPYCATPTDGYHVKNGCLVDSLIAHSSRSVLADKP